MHSRAAAEQPPPHALILPAPPRRWILGLAMLAMSTFLMKLWLGLGAPLLSPLIGLIPLCLLFLGFALHTLFSRQLCHLHPKTGKVSVETWNFGLLYSIRHLEFDTIFIRQRETFFASYAIYLLHGDASYGGVNDYYGICVSFGHTHSQARALANQIAEFCELPDAVFPKLEEAKPDEKQEQDDEDNEDEDEADEVPGASASSKAAP